MPCCALALLRSCLPIHLDLDSDPNLCLDFTLELDLDTHLDLEPDL